MNISGKMTELWAFYVLSVFCIFVIEEFEISKKIFSISYFIISLCSSMTNFKVVGEKRPSYGSFMF